MYLTSEQELMLKGERGIATQKSMEILVNYGDALGAEKLIEVGSSHTLLFFQLPKDVEDVWRFYEMFAGAKAKVPTTTNVCIIPDEWKAIGIPEAAAQSMKKVNEFAIKIGLLPTYTCTPYLVGNVPRMGEHVAWTESAAIAFVNSVMGARTNRDGTQSSLASAITGLTPEWGYHLDENRKGKILVKVQTKLETVADYTALGYYVGGPVGIDVPVFTGIARPTLEDLMGLSAALATSGGVTLHHVVGVTPEAVTEKEAFKGEKPEEKISVGKEEIKSVYEKLSWAKSEKVDLVTVGCPHCTITQLREVAGLLNGKKVHKDVTFWVWTSALMKELARRAGYVEIIESAGGAVLTDSCPNCMGKLMSREGQVMATDSAKQAHYAPAKTKMEVLFGNLNKCTKAALTGTWK